MPSKQQTTTLPAASDWVPETAFGKWFLSTQIWFRYVLTEAIVDLKSIAGNRGSDAQHLVDVGCGQGLAFGLLGEHFRPKTIIGVDIDTRLLDQAEQHRPTWRCNVQLRNCSIKHLDLADASVDTVFCHQLLHHVADQESALRELYRILIPGGTLLLSESCRVFIESWTVRAFFRHPMPAQKSAQDFLELLRSMGFEFSPSDVRESTPWWSLRDFGIARRFGWLRTPPETTELLVVATKPTRFGSG
jgi:ubiquinone/menaquinone biosynthesis C-methylase UbiE